MEEKLEELKDWEGQLSSFAKNKIGKQVKKEIIGTNAEKLLTLVEKGKKDYENLKKLYEKCIADLPKNVTKIIFEAHGTTFDNEAHMASGHNDVDLSALGEKQSKEMGERYKNEKFDVIFCSDLKRSYKSAEIAFGDKFPIIKDARLRECDYGDFTQKPSEIVDKEKINRIDVPFPNGESHKEATERMKSFLNDIKKDYKGKRIMIIGHRATQYGLENIINKAPMEQLVSSKFTWQPGWKYDY
jgi:alpha-ribazole phosphatase/probable phosphoglycerate mutase